MAPVRVAAIDLGTNSTRLLVADVADGRIEEVVRRLTITRLGEGVDRRGRLSPSAVDRTRACLEEFRRELSELGAERVLAIATSALRDAEDGEAFLDALASEYGLETRLLSGQEEAALTFRGVTSDRTLAAETLVVDIGGGSTELVLGDAHGVSFAISLQIGSVRLTERFLPTDPPPAPALAACAAHVRSVLPTLSATRAIGVAGTITTLAAVDLGLSGYGSARVHGHALSRAAVERELEQLAALPLEARRQVPGLHPARAPVIVAGAVVLREIMAAYGLADIEASERDILDGAALAAAELARGDE